MRVLVISIHIYMSKFTPPNVLQHARNGFRVFVRARASQYGARMWSASQSKGVAAYPMSLSYFFRSLGKAPYTTTGTRKRFCRYLPNTPTTA